MNKFKSKKRKFKKLFGIKNVDILRNYSHDSHHSIFINKHFPEMSKNGVDLPKKKVEIKETFANAENTRWAIYYKDVLASNYFLFNNHNRFFYIVPSGVFDKLYKFDNKKALAQPSLKVIKKYAIFKSRNINKIKEYIKKL